MKLKERTGAILEALHKQGFVKAEDLSRELQVSLVTIRKDLQRLEDEGSLIRTFGGAVPCIMGQEEQRRLAAMQMIADRVALDVHDGECIILNAGQTTLLITRNLKQRKHWNNLTVITNSIPIAKELIGQKGIQLILLGGELTADVVFTHGSEAIRQLEQYRADKLILSVSGISCDKGITTRHMEAGELFLKMIERSDGVIVAADDTKIGFESFYFVDEGSSIDWIVTNYCEEKEGELRKMEQMGIQVIRCGACT